MKEVNQYSAVMENEPKPKRTVESLPRWCYCVKTTSRFINAYV